MPGIMLSSLFLWAYALPARSDEAGKAVEQPQTHHNDVAQQMPVRGVVRPLHKTALSTDISARITDIAFKEGAPFFKDDLLIKMDCSRLISEWESAEAYVREMSLSLKSAIYLLSKQTGSQFKVDTARARSDRAKADLKTVSNRMEQCEIRAPYDGLVYHISSRMHEMSSMGKPLISIISYNDPTLELIVPSNWLNWLRTGMNFDFTVDETQATHKSEVTRVGAVVDSVSQTVKIYAKFANSPVEVLPGMSGTAHFK